jgi:hypothetical protein
MAKRLEQQKADAEINSFLRHELVAVNDRDDQKVDRYLTSIRDALRNEVDEFDQLMFGGSIAKHTYVEGLSDVDALVVLGDPGIRDRSPEEFREDFAKTLRARLSAGDVRDISVGKLAVTVEYRDGTQVQLLPAVRTGDAISISSQDGTAWQGNIRPKAFTDALTRTNLDQGRAVVPAIKLAKQIMDTQIPEGRRPSGYHVESMAVEAFSRYDGPRTPKAMLGHFFRSASQRVIQPLPDTTGQSRYVDENFGVAGSDIRRQTSRDLRRIADTIDRSRSVTEWRRLLGQ